MNRWSVRVLPSHLLLSVMSVIAATSLHGVMRGYSLVVLAIGGTLVSLGALLVADRLKLLTAEWVALSLCGLVVFGGIAAGSVPSPGSYSMFFRGLISGWANVLSSVPPIAIVNEYRVLPYVLGWLGATVGFGLLRHVRIPGLAAWGPIGVFGLGLMFSTEVRSVALVQGALLASLALALGFYQHRDLGFENDQELGNTTVARQRTRLLGAGAMLLVVAGLSPVLANSVPGWDRRERFDLRDKLDPPWNPLDEPSPLAEIRGNYLDEEKAKVVFIANGQRIPDRWTLAVLAAYDGTVWTVGDSGVGGEALFLPIDDVTPGDPWVLSSGEPRSGTSIDVDVEIVNLDGPWLPTPGRATEIAAVSSDGSEVDLRFNQRTGTAVAPQGANGLTYSLQTMHVSSPGPQAMDAVTWGVAGPLALEQQAAAVVNESADVVEGVEAGWAQVEAIASSLIEGGSYLATDLARPGHSWSRLAEFSDEATMYGNEEQYAALAAIMARNANIPARVVVGYDLNGDGPHQGTVEVTRDEATAWIEVLTTEYGWMPVDVTPDRDKEPSLQDSGTKTEPVAAPNPPPPPPPPPAAEAATPDELEDEEEDLDPVLQDDSRVPMLVVALAGATMLPILTFGLWTAAVVALKGRRRRRRRTMHEPADRVSGAWVETNDRLLEVGFTGTNNLSVIEQARHVSRSLDDRGPQDRLVGLARAVDVAAFGPGTTLPESADAAWHDYEAIASGLRSDTPISKRLIRMANPTALLKRDSMKKEAAR